MRPPGRSFVGPAPLHAVLPRAKYSKIRRLRLRIERPAKPNVNVCSVARGHVLRRDVRFALRAQSTSICGRTTARCNLPRRKCYRGSNERGRSLCDRNPDAQMPRGAARESRASAGQWNHLARPHDLARPPSIAAQRFIVAHDRRRHRDRHRLPRGDWCLERPCGKSSVRAQMLQRIASSCATAVLLRIVSQLGSSAESSLGLIHDRRRAVGRQSTRH